jgi:hypothetical protein
MQVLLKPRNELQIDIDFICVEALSETVASAGFDDIVHILITVYFEVEGSQ